MGVTIKTGLLNVDDDATVDAENAASAYRLQLLIRRFEEKAGQLYALGLIPDEIKLCIGREALIAGLIGARLAMDRVIFGPRCHGALLALGVVPTVLMSGLANPQRGRTSLPSHEGPDNNSCPKGFYRCDGDNARRVSWALSLAFASMLNRDRSVVYVVLDGDSGTSDPLVRSMSLAKRFQLPIVFIVDHAAPEPEPGNITRCNVALQTAFQASAISLEPIDGIDQDNVRPACQLAGERARARGGPQGLLISTQAFRGHARQPSATQNASSQPIHDPVDVARKRLLDAVDGGVDAAKAIENDIRTTLTALGQEIRAGR